MIGRRTTVAVVLLFLLSILGFAHAYAASDVGKVYVCKYVGTPGVDERLQTGQNPIEVSVNAIKDYAGVGSYFNDAQGRSFVLATVPQDPEPTASDCPGGPQPSTEPSTQPSTTPSVEPSTEPTPSVEPSATPTPSPTSSETPSPTSKPTPPAPTAKPVSTPPSTDTADGSQTTSSADVTIAWLILAGCAVLVGTLIYLMLRPAVTTRDVIHHRSIERD
jgi:hypothetical protein